MNIIRPNSLPRLWWLNPWSTVRYLHDAATALKAYADGLDAAIELQDGIISEQSAEIAFLKVRIEDMNDAIISGTAIQPDAVPHE